MVRGIEVHNGKVVLGDIESLEMSRVYSAGETVTGIIRGARIYLRDDHSDPLTVTGDLYGLYILDMISATPSDDSAMLRLEFNPLATAVRNSVIQVPLSPDADFNYLLSVNPDNKTAWASGGDKTAGIYTSAGWFRVRIGASERWIPLYKVA